MEYKIITRSFLTSHKDCFPEQSGRRDFVTVAKSNINLKMIKLTTLIGVLLFIDAVRSANVLERLTVQDGAICDDRIPAYLVADGHKAASSENKLIYKDVTEQDCKNMCTDNKDFQGNQVMCSSFTYTIKDKTCFIHRGKAAPVGKMELKPATGHRYYEKFCLPEGTPADCGEKPFFRSDQAVLVGFAKNVSHTKNLAVCIQACIEMSAECRSAMFFGAAGECILSVASAQDAPDVFAEEEVEQNVVYFENGCVMGNQVREQKKHNSKTQKVQEAKKPEKSTSVKLVNNSTESTGNSSDTSGTVKEGKETKEISGFVVEDDKKKDKNGKTGEDGGKKNGKDSDEDDEKNKGDEKRKGKDSNDDEKRKGNKSEEDEVTTVRPRKPSHSESREVENVDNGRKRTNDSSQEQSVSKSTNVKQRVTLSIGGRNLGKGAGTKRLLQNAALSSSGEGSAWGTWSEECKSFDERRPCTNGNRVGFQSRQCLRTLFECQGPFFRYCIVPC